MAKVADVIVRTLSEAGAERCWGIVGDTINHFTDVLRRSDIRWMHVRHEEAGAFAAGAEAYVTGRLAVCAGTCGPGSLHFVNGIFESHRNGAPVVLIASDVDRAQAGMGFPQEVDQEKIYAQCSVFCQTIRHPAQAGRVTALAAQAALTRGGVAVVIVNGDMFTEEVPDDLPWSVHRPAPVVRPSEAELAELAGMIDAAERTTIYAGIGARNAHDEVVALARVLKAPVAHTTRAKEFIEPDNPFNVGMTGILGNRAGMAAMEGCDLLLCLGSDFAYTQFYPENARIVQLDIDPTHIGRRVPVDLGLVGDVGATIRALGPHLRPRGDDRFLRRMLARYRKDLQGYLGEAEEPDPNLIHPQYLTRVIDALADDDAAFTADGGSPMVWMLRHLTANGTRSFLTSLGHGTMANAYPQAMGIKAAQPARQVIALCGDGGFSMLMGDLMTLRQENLPVKIAIFNNASLGFVEMEQRVEGMLDAFTGLDNPDFAMMARAAGLEGWQVEDARDLPAAVQRWLDAPGPALLDVKVSRMELVMPPKIEAGQVASTAMFGIKAVLDGRTGEVVSLLRDNFLK